MSTAEIADNKWEVDASKPKFTDPAGLAQLVMMGGFSLCFAYILIFSVIGMFTTSDEGSLESQFSHMDDGAKKKNKKPEADAPAE